MFRSKTLFIVGAGASKEANFPIGTELTEKIAHSWDFEFDCGFLKKGNPQFLGYLQRSLGDNHKVNEHIKSGRQFSEGLKLANSIDSYIYAHQHDPNVTLCGKMGIVYTILNEEKK